ncbi:MAG: DegT/DnrJ/EryC1/StrS family aminotransferase, partial [Bacteroidales bacterium]
MKNKQKSEAELRAEILTLVKNYYEVKFSSRNALPFEKGKDAIHYAGRVFDENELQNLVDSSLDFWLTEGRYAKMFQKEFSQYMGLEHAILTNSGSSANLLALTALTSVLLGSKRLKKGDEVITVAAGFPTTVNPIIQNGLVPVFVDVELGSYNVAEEQLKHAITAKTKAIMLAHTLGNPFELEKIMRLAEDYNLYVVEDCCDALGSRYKNQLVGSFGNISTFSFYPAHHITMGEGGMVCTKDAKI